MESFQPINTLTKSAPVLESRSEFGPELAQIISYMQGHNFGDLTAYVEREFKTIRRNGLAEKNLRHLDDLSKFRSPANLCAV